MTAVCLTSTLRDCRVVEEGETRLKAQELRERGEMVQLLLHHLLLHGGGLSLGPDCDGLLNFMDSDELPEQEGAKRVHQLHRCDCSSRCPLERLSHSYCR